MTTIFVQSTHQLDIRTSDSAHRDQIGLNNSENDDDPEFSHITEHLVDVG
jgi:hypothetical protein